MRLVLGLEYNGANYCGWQRQSNVPTVQGYLESAVSKVADEQVMVFCAGRTDSGVHATGQVVHFDTSSVRSQSSWIFGINSNLPSDIVVRWVVVSIDLDFHARFSAIARRYQYIIYNYPVRSALLSKGVGHCRSFLDIKRMQIASQCLLGEQDFSSFRALKCQSSSAYRNVHYLWIRRKGNYVVIDIQANAFVYHMVRNIIASLMEVGSGKRSETWIAELLSKKNRLLSGGIIAPPDGLYLVKVKYPGRFSLP